MVPNTASVPEKACLVPRSITRLYVLQFRAEFRKRHFQFLDNAVRWPGTALKIKLEIDEGTQPTPVTSLWRQVNECAKTFVCTAFLFIICPFVHCELPLTWHLLRVQAGIRFGNLPWWPHIKSVLFCH